MSSNALLEQALAFYRTPARFLDFRDPGRPLGGDVRPLLRLAGGATPESLKLAPGLASTNEWQAAARFFVEQVLLAPGADYYRLHGVTVRATDVEIKAHHRLLMRFLHPDREHSDEAWHTAAAARINQAYAILRDTDKRAQYNTQIEFEAQNARATPNAPLLTPAPVRRPMHARYRSGDTPLQRYVWRHLPQVSLAVLVVVASVSISWIWLSNEPSAALGGGDGGSTIVALKTLPAETAAAPSAAPRQEVVTDTPATEATVGAAQLQPVEQALTLVGGNSRVVTSGAADANGIKLPAKASPPSPQKSSRPALEMPLAVNRHEPSPSPLEPAPALELRADTKLEKRASEDPGSVIPQLALRYERGNLEQFMALFHDGAHNETGDRSKIRKDYEDLFTSTTSRQLIVWDMRWTPRGETVKGEGRFQARIQRQNESFQRLYNGTLNIEVLAEGNPPLILGIYHHVSNQSNN
ncbi:J domain-containing protein [Propionivibrio sp.]|uniref:J domain-containing protein n=1 Tax=Propionivibrio sp. TaxID=2212460 RepID=UPI002637BD8C|nr:J domain-containing protein [Propionivibrio sp.]